MINLLPENEKSELLLKRIKNLALVLGAIVIIFLICLMLVLLSIKFYILAKVDYQKFLYDTTVEKYKTPDMVNYKTIIDKSNAFFPIVNSFYKNEKFLSDVLALISEVQKPSGLRFTNISVDEKGKVSIAGTSSTRENVVAFQKNLEAQPEIKNVSFSASSWINAVNNSFNLTLEYGN
jgi:hypothetical protein